MAIVEQVDPGVEHVSPPRARRGRALLAAALLLAVYGVLSVANDPHGYLGTDTGGKVLTLQAMEDRGSTTNLDVGYWAEEHDPEGRLHPYFGTGRIGVRWIQVTTVPLLLAASPLYDLGGYRLALLLPMLGGVLVAAAARALAQRFGADRAQAWWAFWLVGLAGPVVVYALDLWEHTLGLAAMAWAVVLLADARRSSAPPRGAPPVPGCCGASASRCAPSRCCTGRPPPRRCWSPSWSPIAAYPECWPWAQPRPWASQWRCWPTVPLRTRCWVARFAPGGPVVRPAAPAPGSRSAWKRVW